MNEIIVNEAKAGIGVAIKAFFAAHKVVIAALGGAAAGSAVTVGGQQAYKAIKKRKLNASIAPVDEAEEEAAATEDDKVKPINRSKKNNAE